MRSEEGAHQRGQQPQGSTRRKRPTPQSFPDGGQPRAEEPVHFTVRPRPKPRSSVDHVSSASSSYDAASQTSSSFTLSSTTDGSSASSSLFENRKKSSESSSTSNAFTFQLKKLYQELTHIENKIKQENTDTILSEDDEETREIWETRIQNHKKFVATVQNLLEISLAPSVPASLRTVPTKYNLANRLWTHGFSLLLESLRRAAFSSPGSQIALEHLTEFIYYAYTFYATLLEEPQLALFRGGWLEALGDLARYKSMVESHLERSGRMPTSSTAGQSVLTDENLCSSQEEDVPMDTSAARSNSIDMKSAMTLSIGRHAAAALVLEPEPERWRHLAREWYGMGLNDQPGTGKLHHNIGLLCRDAAGNTQDIMRGVYHFFKSMVTLHPFSLSRESVLPLLTPLLEENQTSPPSLTTHFLTLHGIIYTDTNLESFDSLLLQFMNGMRNSNSLSEREWVMMSVINIAAVLEHGKTQSVLRRAMGGVSTTEAADNDRMEVDEEFAGLPVLFIRALELTFSLFSHALDFPFIEGQLNPYIPVLMTFLTTVLKSINSETTVATAIQRFVPWQRLALFLQNIPLDIWESQHLVGPSFKSCAIEERWPMLTTSTAPPVPEDWCLRGMEWVGRRVYERGFWRDNGGDDEKFSRVEIRYLYEKEEKKAVDMNRKRLIRVLRCGISLSFLVRFFSWTESTAKLEIT